MILFMGFKYGTMYTKTHDIFLILCMQVTGKYTLINNIDEPIIVTLFQESYKNEYRKKPSASYYNYRLQYDYFINI